MARDIIISGETLLQVKGASNSTISTLTQLGLASTPVTIRFMTHYDDIHLDAFGGDAGAPNDVQFMLAEAQISCTLVQFDQVVLRTLQTAGMGNAPVEGQMPRAGTRLGGGVARFGANWSFISLNLTSPVLSLPWRFYNTYLTDALSWPLGTKRSLVNVTFRALPYSVDPYGGGTGAQGVVLYDHVLDAP